MIDRLHQKYREHPSILMSKLRYDFARAGPWYEKIWSHLRLHDFFIEHVMKDDQPIRALKMVSDPPPNVLESIPENAQFILFETDTDTCPVKTFEYFKSRIYPDAASYFDTMLLLDDTKCIHNQRFWFSKKIMPKNRREGYFKILQDLISQHVVADFTFEDSYGPSSISLTIMQEKANLASLQDTTEKTEQNQMIIDAGKTENGQMVIEAIE